MRVGEYEYVCMMSKSEYENEYGEYEYERVYSSVFSRRENNASIHQEIQCQEEDKKKCASIMCTCDMC